MTNTLFPARLRIGLTCLLACSSGNAVFSHQSLAQDAQLQQAFTRIEAYFRQCCQNDATPGAALVLTTPERSLTTLVHGVAEIPSATPVSPETLFAIGSIGKSFTAVTLLALQDEQKFDFQKPVQDYLPWWNVRSQPAIRGHHLVTHTANIPGYRGDMSCSLFETAWLNDAPIQFNPGKQFHYSSNAYSILGHLIEVCGEKDYGEMVREKILTPLAMTNSEPVLVNAMRTQLAASYVPLYHGQRPTHPEDPLVDAGFYEYTKGAGSVCCTAPDLAKYLRMLLKRGEGVLTSQSFDTLIRPGYQYGPDHAYGYGLDVRTAEGKTLIQHAGGCFGFRSNLVGELDSGCGAVLLANGPVTMNIANFAVTALRAARLDQPLPPVPAPIPVTFVATDYLGAYKTASGQTLTIQASGDHLNLTSQEQTFSLVPRGGDRFCCRHPEFSDFLLSFQRKSGQVNKVVYGSDCYFHEHHESPPESPLPESWAGLTGHFAATTLPPTSFRIVAREGQLLFVSPGGGETPLQLLNGSTFRVGDAPEWLTFQHRIDGRAMRVEYSGMHCYRK